MINIIVLAGKSASGKNFVAKKLEEHGYETIVTYTTRSKRKGEKQDITYHFISDEEFNQKIDEGFLQMRTWDTNYAELRNMYFQRRHHRLKEEWIDTFCKWVESLPYAKELIMYEG